MPETLCQTAIGTAAIIRLGNVLEARFAASSEFYIPISIDNVFVFEKNIRAIRNPQAKPKRLCNITTQKITPAPSNMFCELWEARLPTISAIAIMASAGDTFVAAFSLSLKILLIASLNAIGIITTSNIDNVIFMRQLGRILSLSR